MKTSEVQSARLPDLDYLQDLSAIVRRSFSSVHCRNGILNFLEAVRSCLMTSSESVCTFEEGTDSICKTSLGRATRGNAVGPTLHRT